MKQILHNLKPNLGYQIRILLIPVLFAMFTNLASGQIISDSYAILKINGGSVSFYKMQNGLLALPAFDGNNLGIFTKGVSTLVFSGGQNRTDVTSNGSCNFTTSSISYRVYLTGNPSGSYVSVNEPSLSSGGGVQTFEQSNGTSELIASLPVGSYTLEVFSQADYDTCATGTVLSNNGGANYKATFTVVNPQSVWNGATWSNGAPTATVEAVIDGAYSTSADGAIAALKLTVNSGKTLTINTGTTVTVQNEVVNNGMLTIENNGNLLQVNDVANSGSGSTIVNRNSNPLFRSDYTLWSSPVSGIQTLEQFSPLTTQTPISRFYVYDHTLGTAGLYSSVSPGTIFAAGTGYLIRMPNTDPTTGYDVGTATLAYPGVFTGTANNGTVTLNSLTSAKYYAVGNPYPSTIDANAFISGNDTDGTLYFWRKTNGTANTTSSYATWTNVGTAGSTNAPNNVAPDGTIAVGQGFIVKTGAAALNFTNTMRTTSTSAQFFKTKKTVDKSRVWLNLTNSSVVFSQALIGYLDGATQGVDKGIDGKYINDGSIALTSLINNEEYIIQGRPAFDATDIVALNFKTTVAGDYSITIDHMDGLFAAGQAIYLLDSKTGTETNLKEGGYNFNAAAGVDDSRFSLKYQKTLKVDASALKDNSVQVYKNKGVLYVNAGAKAIKNIKVYDIQGRLITEQKNVKANTATISNLKPNNQVLIVRVTGEDNSEVTKKVMN